MAFQLWDEALQAGGIACIDDMARCYEQGDCVEKDMTKAVALYKKGAECTANTWRRSIVQPFLGLCLIQGRGIEQDVKKGWNEMKSAVLFKQSATTDGLCKDTVMSTVWVWCEEKY